MNPQDLDNKILYFEMHTRPPDKSALFFTKGWAKMDALSGGYVSLLWWDYPGASSGKSVTLKPEVVAQFKKNEAGRTFEMGGKSVTPDFTYIEAAR
jgi:hypothetical protein